MVRKTVIKKGRRSNTFIYPRVGIGFITAEKFIQMIIIMKIRSQVMEIVDQIKSEIDYDYLSAITCKMLVDWNA